MKYFGLFAFFLALGATIVGVGGAWAQERSETSQASQDEPSEADLLRAKYEARLDALELSNQSLDRVVQVGGWIGFTIAAVAVIGSFYFGKSISDIRDQAEKTAKNSIQDAIRGTNEKNGDLQNVLEDVKNTSQRLKDIESELSGYVTLRDVAQSASGFDPLVEYYEIYPEIDRRAEATTRMRTGDQSIDPKDTSYDRDFRQRIALVFDRLLTRLRENEKSGTQKLTSSDYFNLSANASKLGMDFVSLEFMEAAERIAKGSDPEVTSRLVRLRLSMTVITDEEAKELLRKALRDTSADVLHLVVSEAFNIGVSTSDPIGVAEVIMNELPEDLRASSICLLNASRLSLFGSTQEHWSRARELYVSGIDAFAKEAPTARWFKDSAAEIAKIVEADLSLMELGDPPILERIEKGLAPDVFIKKYGFAFFAFYNQHVNTA